MTRTSILNLAATLVAAALSTSAVHAQTPTALGVVTVPFAFDAGTSHLRPGTYSIKLIGENRMLIDNSSSHGITMARRESDNKGSAATRVVFHRYGDKYYLRQVWDAGQNTHMESIESKAEATARKAPKQLLFAGAAAPAAVEVSILASAR